MDYQNDCLLIGLKELYEGTVIDFARRSHIYTNHSHPVYELYGKGFTVTKIIPDCYHDRSELEYKIKNQFFDLVIYGSIHRCDVLYTQINSIYPAHKVLIIDGEDEPWKYHTTVFNNHPYFKREQSIDSAKYKNVFPISFAFPTCLVNLDTPKTKELAFITPKNKDTYIYDNQESYYNDYRTSFFGITIKKSGWDCMRHYEIMGNGCIPYFEDINECPETTMVSFPKQLCIDILQELKSKSYETVYNSYHQHVKDHFIKHNTTISLANYVINTALNYL